MCGEKINLYYTEARREAFVKHFWCLYQANYCKTSEIVSSNWTVWGILNSHDVIVWQEHPNFLEYKMAILWVRLVYVDSTKLAELGILFSKLPIYSNLHWEKGNFRRKMSYSFIDHAFMMEFFYMICFSYLERKLISLLVFSESENIAVCKVPSQKYNSGPIGVWRHHREKFCLNLT